FPGIIHLLLFSGLKKRTRKAFGIRKKEKDNDSTGSPDRDGVSNRNDLVYKPFYVFVSKKTNGAPNGFYGDIDWDRYNSPEVDDEGYSIRPEDELEEEDILSTVFNTWQFLPSYLSEEEEDHRKKFKIKIKPLPPDRVVEAPSVDELKASIGNIALSPSPMVSRSGFTDFAPPLPTSPPPKDDIVPPLPTSPPPSEEQVVPSVRSGPPTPQDQNPPTLATSPSPATKELSSPPVSSPPPLSSPPSVPPAPTPKISTPPAVTPPSEEPAARSVPPPLVLCQEEKPNNTSTTYPKEDGGETVTSPKDAIQGSRSTPPPPPPPTYRAVVSSPGPTSGAGGTNSGSSSPVRPATPSSVNPTPPPPPPRPPSRPKLPPGKPSVGDANRPFSPPIHSASPPPIAPLARAESTSSISSTNSMSAATTPTVENDQPSLVWFDRGKFYLTFEGCSRGPSPLTMGAQDTLPVAAAFTETVNAFFKGADPNKCAVKIIGEMVLSFPAGITRHFANNPSPAVLTFSITNYSRLEHVLPNPQLLCCDTTTQAKADSKDFWVNMPNLISHLKKVAEQKPQATYYNVDMLKYQVSTQGLQSTPLNLAVSWRCEPTSTDLRIDYKYNGEAMSTPMALNNVQFLIPVDGGVSKLQAVLPPAAWNADQQRILWKIPDISHKSENGGVGSLLARFQLTEGPSKPAPLAVQFTSEGSTLSGCDIELAGPGYRFSLIKKRFAAGKYLADN
uniref:SH3GL interacting endocytic adaptor 1 n=1 Tax=Oreochromis niloticus TaxID=8128 RepID=I3JUL1_ORENI